jgi:hypothetical protein
MSVRTTQRMTQSVLALRAFLERKNQDHLHTLKRGKRKVEDAVNTSSESKDNLLPWGPEILMDSLMLGSIYSHVKELLRKTPS